MSKRSAITWDVGASAAVNARRVLPLMVAQYIADVRKLLARDPPPARLHAVRLASKRIRYTLELFRPCYGPGLEKRLAPLRSLQQVLGEVNDCAATERLIQKLIPDSPSRRRAERYLRERAGRKAAELRTDWREWFDAPGRERWWVEYFAKGARTNPRRSRTARPSGPPPVAL